MKKKGKGPKPKQGPVSQSPVDPSPGDPSPEDDATLGDFIVEKSIDLTIFEDFPEIKDYFKAWNWTEHLTNPAGFDLELVKEFYAICSTAVAIESGGFSVVVRDTRLKFTAGNVNRHLKVVKPISSAFDHRLGSTYEPEELFKLCHAHCPLWDIDIEVPKKYMSLESRLVSEWTHSALTPCLNDNLLSDTGRLIAAILNGKPINVGELIISEFRRQLDLMNKKKHFLYVFPCLITSLFYKKSKITFPSSRLASEVGVLRAKKLMETYNNDLKDESPLDIDKPSDLPPVCGVTAEEEDVLKIIEKCKCDDSCSRAEGFRCLTEAISKANAEMSGFRRGLKLLAIYGEWLCGEKQACEGQLKKFLDDVGWDSTKVKYTAILFEIGDAKAAENDFQMASTYYKLAHNANLFGNMKWKRYWMANLSKFEREQRVELRRARLSESSASTLVIKSHNSPQQFQGNSDKANNEIAKPSAEALTSDKAPVHECQENSHKENQKIEKTEESAPVQNFLYKENIGIETTAEQSAEALTSDKAPVHECQESSHKENQKIEKTEESAPVQNFLGKEGIETTAEQSAEASVENSVFADIKINLMIKVDRRMNSGVENEFTDRTCNSSLVQWSESDSFTFAELQAMCNSHRSLLSIFQGLCHGGGSEITHLLCEHVYPPMDYFEKAVRDISCVDMSGWWQCIRTKFKNYVRDCVRALVFVLNEKNDGNCFIDEIFGFNITSEGSARVLPSFAPFSDLQTSGKVVKDLLSHINHILYFPFHNDRSSAHLLPKEVTDMTKYFAKCSHKQRHTKGVPIRFTLDYPTLWSLEERVSFISRINDLAVRDIFFANTLDTAIEMVFGDGDTWLKSIKRDELKEVFDKGNPEVSDDTKAEQIKQSDSLMLVRVKPYKRKKDFPRFVTAVYKHCKLLEPRNLNISWLEQVDRIIHVDFPYICWSFYKCVHKVFRIYNRVNINPEPLNYLLNVKPYEAVF